MTEHPEKLLCPRCQQWTLKRSPLYGFWHCGNPFCRFAEEDDE